MEQAIAVRQLSGRAWRRVVLVAALVALLVAGSISLIYAATADEPAPTGGQAPASATEDVGSISRLSASCREAVAIPKRGWVCTGR
jgi:hypothetical protein